MSLRKPIVFDTTFETYQATEIIGEGGSARVFKATDDAGRAVAIKLLDPMKATSEKIKRFKNEYRFCSNNPHPHIVPVTDHGVLIDDQKSSPFFVMPLYSGSLRTLLEVGIPTGRVLPYFAQLLDGTEAAHLREVVHRDLKPENVLYYDDADRLLLADFGIARFAEEELYTLVETKSQSRLANFQYAAPEQRDRGLEVDHRADIYALGLILNEMYTGEIPYGTEYKTIGAVAPEFEYLDYLVASMLRRKPEDRPSDIQEVKNQLIAHKNEFITRQRISRLASVVIPVGELDDPLIVNPPELVGFDWNNGQLTLILSQPVNKKWESALHNMGGHQFLGGYPPERFSFAGNETRLPAQERSVQDIIDYFKGWLPRANTVYKESVERETKKAEETERRNLQQELEVQEARRRVLRDVRI